VSVEEDVRIEDPDHPLNHLDFKPVLKWIPKNSTLLDVGCGRGTWLLYLRKYRPDVISCGVDISKRYVEICRRKGLNVRLGDVLNLNFQDDEWDIVTCFHVLEHIADDRRALEELMRVAYKRVILILPARPIKMEQIETIEKYHYIPFYTPLTLKRLLRGIPASIYDHYNPTGVYESWLVLTDLQPHL